MKENEFKGHIAGSVRWGANGSYCYFCPNDLPFELPDDPELRKELNLTLVALSRLDGKVSQMSPEERDVLRMNFSLKESTMSSSIEGTVSTLDDVYLSEKVPEKTEREAYDNKEIRNYKNALDCGFRMIGSNRKISDSMIRELHAELMKGVRGSEKSPGEYKTEQNAIGSYGDTLSSARMVPASPASVPHLIENWVSYVNSDSDVLVKVAVSHYQFEVIHPFRDGNGRIGRLMIPLILYDADILHYPILYLSEYFNSHRKEYLDGLFNVSSRDMFREWVLFVSKALRTQAEASSVAIDKLQNYRRSLTENEQNANIIHTAELLFKNPYITSEDIVLSLKVSAPTANKILRKLEERGIIREITGKERNRVYRADDIMEILQNNGMV
ncbi:Fic family protein [Methanosarcinaceae archaeon]|nr:Fic family protein [Methanosarcinaceae archaeon]